MAMAIIMWFIFSIVATVLTACLSLSFGFMAYLYYIHKINEHLPGPPRSSFIFGHLLEIKKYRASTGGTFTEFVWEKQLKYGPIFILFFIHQPTVYLGDASYVRHVYINNSKNLSKFSFHSKAGFVYGERGAGFGLAFRIDKTSWRKRRTLMNPAFHRKCLKDFMSSFNSVCDRFVEHMDAVIADGKPMCMVEEFRKVTLEIVSKVSFNINTHTIEDPNSPFPEAIREHTGGIQDNFDIPFHPILLAIFQFKLFQNATKREQINATKFLRNFASDCISTRMKDIANGKDVPDDLLSVLIKDGSLSLDDIIDEFLTIFLAGHETTSNMLSFALYEIIRNPYVEEKLLTEVNTVLGERDDVAFEDLAKLKYLGQILDEALRKYPVVPGLKRMLTKEITVGGYHIPKGNKIYSEALFFSRNSEIWENPEIFNPDRFADVKNIQDFSIIYFPFAIGPRNCIGQAFAKFESKVILAKLLRTFQFQLIPGQTGKMVAKFTMTPRHGVMCKVSRRE